MKLLVFSDSHGNVEHMRRAVEQEHPDQILHLGDVMRDAVELSLTYPNIPVELVPGNCDYATDVPAQKILYFEGRRILMTHGHIYHVKLGIGQAVRAAVEAKVDVLLFGHTHEAFCCQQDGLWVIALLLPRSVPPALPVRWPPGVRGDPGAKQYRTYRIAVR